MKNFIALFFAAFISITAFSQTKYFPNILDVHEIAANAGHDTDKVKATDKAYNNLHGCCKYRDGGQKCSGDQDDHDHEDDDQK